MIVPLFVSFVGTASACETGIWGIVNSAPADKSTGQPTSVTVSWTFQRNGGCSVSPQYTVFYGTVNPPSNKACASTTTTSCALPTLTAGRTYYWFVEGVDQYAEVNDGPTWSFSTNSAPYAPSQPSPASGASNQPRTLTLGWAGGDPDAGDSVTYTVVFDGTTRCSGISTTSCSPPTPMGYGTSHTWTVTSRDSRGATASSTWSFTVTPDTTPPAPGSPNPPDNTIDVSTTPTLTWGAVTDSDGDAVKYDVALNEVTSNPPPPPSTIICSNLATTSCSIPASKPLSPMTVYVWSVAAKDPAGHAGKGTWAFRTRDNPPAAPSGPTPADGASGVVASSSVTLSWSTSDPDSGDVVTSTVTMSANSGPTSQVCKTTSKSCTVSLLGNTHYVWQVTATDSFGTQTAGPSWSFNTANHAPASPSNPSPADGTGNLGPSVALSWSSNDADPNDVLSYTVKLDAGTGTPNTVVCSGMSASCTVSVGPSTTYSWTVTVNDGHTSVTGSRWTFSTTNDAAPTACFSESTDSSSALVLHFDATCSSAKFGSVASYSWNFGDGHTGSGATPTHSYACPGGLPVVTLTVTDTYGDAGATSHSVSSQDVDNDGDGLYRCQEIQQGTSDSSVDSVGDGIGDFTRSQWNPNRDAIFCKPGTSTCAYPDTNQKDLYIQMDHMTGHPLSATEKQTAIDSFSAAGIHAIIDDGAYGGGNEIPLTQYSSWSNYQGWRNQYFPSNRAGIFHYGVMACSSSDDIYGGGTTFGAGSGPGDAVMIFDCSPNVHDTDGQAKEIMHEFGHNLLGLHIFTPNCSGSAYARVVARNNPAATSLDSTRGAGRCSTPAPNYDYGVHASTHDDPMFPDGPTGKTTTRYPTTTANALKLDWSITTFEGVYDCMPVLPAELPLPPVTGALCPDDYLPDTDLDPLLAPVVTSVTGGNRAATIAWQAPVTTDTLEGYLVFRDGARIASGGCSDLVTATQCTDTGLDDDVSYAYTVQGVFAASNGARSAPAFVSTVVPPSAPTLAVAPGAYQALLSWTMPAGSTNPDDALVTSYEVYRADQPNAAGTLLATVTGASYADTTLAPGQLAYYSVRAVNPAGHGDASAPVSITLSGPAVFAVGSGATCSNGWYCGSTPVTLNVQGAAAKQGGAYPGVSAATVYEDLNLRGRLDYLDEAETTAGWTAASVDPSTVPALSTDGTTHTQAYGALTIRVTNDPAIPIDTTPTVTKTFAPAVSLSGDDAVGMDVFFVSTNGQTRPLDVVVSGTVGGTATSVSTTVTPAYGAWTPVTVAPLPSGFTATSVKLTLHEYAKSVGSTSAPVQVVTVDGLRGFNRASLTELTDGIHRWTVSVVDGAGKQEWVGGPTIKLDRVAPATTATVEGTPSESASWYQAAATVTLASADLTSGIAGTYYTVDGGAQQTYTAPFQTPGTSGVHTIRYWSVDRAGNAEGAHVMPINVDVSPPSVAFSFVKGGSTVSGHADPSGTTWIPAGTQVRITGSDAGSGVKTICYAFDVSAYTCVAGTSVTLTPAHEGYQVLHSYAADNAGYRSATGAGRFAYDSQAPVIDAYSPTGSGAPISSVVRIDFHDPGANASGVDASTIAFKVELVTGSGSLTQYTDVTSQGALVTTSGNVTWTPSAALAPSQTYRVTFGVSDYATNRVTLVWSFQTGVA